MSKRGQMGLTLKIPTEGFCKAQLCNHTYRKAPDEFLAPKHPIKSNDAFSRDWDILTLAQGTLAMAFVLSELISFHQ
jgi:hypothetical protein